jgi:hypothetical protein
MNPAPRLVALLALASACTSASTALAPPDATSTSSMVPDAASPLAPDTRLSLPT